jgi:hypothetical protein
MHMSTPISPVNKISSFKKRREVFDIDNLAEDLGSPLMETHSKFFPQSDLKQLLYTPT